MYQTLRGKNVTEETSGENEGICIYIPRRSEQMDERLQEVCEMDSRKPYWLTWEVSGLF
jgi:hypothetical protein